MTPELILLIAQLASTSLSQIESGTTLGKDAEIAAVLLALYQKTASAYQAVTGQPIDEANVPLETPLPDTPPIV